MLSGRQYDTMARERGTRQAMTSDRDKQVRYQYGDRISNMEGEEE